MKPKLLILDKNSQIDEAIAYLQDKEYVSFDTETTGVHKGAEIIGFSFCASETEAYYVILSGWDKMSQSLLPYVDKYKALELLKVIATKQLIMHNGLFDCAMVANFFKLDIVSNFHTDTMILAHLLNENRRVGLKELAKEYFGESSVKEAAEMKASVTANGGTTTKASYQMYKADPMLMAKYGAQDALLTYKLFYILIPELYEQKLDTFFYEEESMPLLKGPTYQLNTVGLKVDQQALTTLKKTLISECEIAKAYIISETFSAVKEKYPGLKKKDHFNIGSTSQLSWLLFCQLGLEFGNLTKEGKNVCRALGLKLPYTYALRKQFIETCLASKGQVYQPEATTLKGKVRAKKVKDPWGYIACDKTTLKKLAPKYKWIAIID